MEYTLTPLGATLMGIVEPLILWADAHVADISAARERFDRLTPGKDILKD